MSKIDRTAAVDEALDLLDDVGLDAVSTRALARRLGVEQPSLYWHFENKTGLLRAMAEAAMLPHRTVTLPQPPQDWREWFLENTRSFRRTLLQRRDGARLHAGTTPADIDRTRLEEKLAFLTASGVPERAAAMAMITASRFTVGSVLEQQAEEGLATATAATAAATGRPADVPAHDELFEAGLALILTGLRCDTTNAAGQDL